MVAAKSKRKGFFEKLGDKVNQMLEAELETGERLVMWVNGQTSPAEWWSIVPVLSILHKLRTKHWIIALTDRRLMLLRHLPTSATETIGEESIPLKEIRHMEMEKGVLFVALVVHTNSGIWKFKEMEKEEVLPFIEAYESIKSVHDR